MKNFIVFLGMSLLATSISAQSWISSSRITSTVSLFEISSAIDDLGDVFSFGYYEGTLELPNDDTVPSNGGRDYYLMKFLADGNVDWVKNFGSPAHEWFTGGVDIDSEGNAYITGGFQGTMKYSETDSLVSTGTLDAFLIKINTTGDVEWAKNIGQGFFLQFTTAINAEDNDEILVAGSFRDSIVFNDNLTLYSVPLKYDAFYAKFNPADGELIWAKQAEALNGQQGYIWSIESNADNYYFSGTFIDTIVFESNILTSDFENDNAFIVNTSTTGEFGWYRKIEGDNQIYGYSSILDDEGNVYISSFYNSDTIYIQSSETEFIEVAENKGSWDIYVIKYSPLGEMEWYRSIGGKGSDRVFDITYFEEKIWLAGFISDTVYWGGISLTTTGTDDQDMFTGSLSKDGEPRDANSYAGIEKSTDEARAIFQNGEQLYTVMRSNSKLLELGDDNYISDGELYYLVLGVIGCNPISIDNTIYTDVTGCYGDSTGAIQISSSGGFGSPWQYSVDNGLSYQESPYFPQLPIGDYQVLVIDKENCTEVGQVVTLSQPDSLEVQLISSSDITVDEDGSIVVGAQGGTSPYTYTLMPDNVLQGFGTFTFARGDSGQYVVELNDVNLCGPVSTDTIWIQDLSSVGINELGGLMLRVFPNPTSDVVTVEMPMEAAEVSMEVLSLAGQVVLRRQAFTTGGVLRETIDVSDLADGMYMLRLNGETLKSAFVVN